MGDTVDFVTLMCKAHKKISAERKDCLNPVLNEDFKTLCDNETSDLNYCFEENLLESMRGAKQSFRTLKSLLNNSTTKFHRVNYQ